MRALQNLSGEDDIRLMLAKSWADATIELLSSSRERRRTFRALDSMFERGDGDGITWESVLTAERHVWSTDCLLILSASNLETWIARLYRARHRRAPEPLPNLRRLRNAIEHLDEANLDEETWTATARTRQGQRSGIGALPDGELFIGAWGDDRLFGVISHVELEQLAAGLLNELGRELDDYARDWFEFIAEDR